MSTRRVTLGRVAGVFGVQGWVKVYSYTRPPENILQYRRWWLSQGVGFEARVIAGEQHNRSLVAQITDANGVVISDRDVAAQLIGTEIQVEQSALPKLPQGQFYWAELIGMTVENCEAVALGTVSDVTSNGPQDVLVVKQGEVERLIPLIRPQFVKAIDPEQNRIVCDWQADW